MEDVVGFKDIQSIPIKIKNSKCWGDTPVVDFEKVKSLKFVNLDLLKMDNNLMKEYILNLMFKFVLGIPDFADRNFYIKNDHIYALDQDSIHKTFTIKSQLGSEKKYAEVIKFIKENFDYFEKTLLEWQHLN